MLLLSILFTLPVAIDTSHTGISTPTAGLFPRTSSFGLPAIITSVRGTPLFASLARRFESLGRSQRRDCYLPRRRLRSYDIDRLRGMDLRGSWRAGIDGP